MNCRELRKHITDYIGDTLCDELAGVVREHIRQCRKCASLVRELEATSSLVRSLERVAVPAGFEHRLAQRLAHRGETSHQQVGAWTRVLLALRWAFVGAPDAWRPLMKPAIAGVLFCVLIAGSLFMALHGTTDTSRTAVDTAYIETIREQHATFAVSNPLADESAIFLKERSGDLEGQL